MTKQWDVVVFGATGFTGERVVGEVVVASKSEKTPLRWAIAGRNEAKLKDVLARRAPGVEGVGIVIADVSNEASLAQMAASTRVLMNCVGPYRFYGEQVVKACVENGCDYVDITGEPQFIESMGQKYDSAAKSRNVLVVPTCGFDSIPADIGARFTAELFGPGKCSSVESFLSLECPNGAKGHYATFESAVHGFGAAAELAKLRKKDTRAPPVKVGPSLRRHTKPYFEPRMNRWSLPFPGSDASVVRNSQVMRTAQGKDSIQFAAYFTVSGFTSLLLTVAIGTVFQLFARFSVGRKLLLAFPGFFTMGAFSHEGPSEKQMATTSFTMKFFGKGYTDDQPSGKPTKTVVTCIKGLEPGYVATPQALVQSGSPTLESTRITLHLVHCILSCISGIERSYICDS